MEKENNGKEIKVVFAVTQEKLSSRVLINILISLSKAATSTDTNSWIESVGGSVWGRGGRKGQLHPSVQALLFPSQQLPLMAVIYMANWQCYVYKILGKKDLNNSCQASKGTAVGSDPAFLFSSFLCTFCQRALLHSSAA